MGTSSIHLCEITYCDVIKRQITSLLTVSGDIRKKTDSGIFYCIFTTRIGDKCGPFFGRANERIGDKFRPFRY